MVQSSWHTARVLLVSVQRWAWVAVGVAGVVSNTWLLLRPSSSDIQAAQLAAAAKSTALVSPPVGAPEVTPILPQSLVTQPKRVEVQRLDAPAFDAALRDQPHTLGAIALGRPNRGSLYNAVKLSDSDPRWRLEVPEHAYGTAETVGGIEAAIAEVNRLFPGTSALSIGHISSQGGGWLRPHRSHQNGRDVDLGFYYKDDSSWYRKATLENLDVPRTWALLSGLERASGLEYAFVDQSLHAALREHAEQIGEPPTFIEYMFDGPLPLRGPTIRHERGHLTHLHVRFLSPVAVENAVRARALAGKGGRNSTVLAALLKRSNQRVATNYRKPRYRSTRGRGMQAKAPGSQRPKVL